MAVVIAGLALTAGVVVLMTMPVETALHNTTPSSPSPTPTTPTQPSATIPVSPLPSSRSGSSSASPTSKPPLAAGNPLQSAHGFYYPYNWNGMAEVETLRAAGRAADAALVEKAVKYPLTMWMTGTRYDMSNLSMVLNGGGKEKGAMTSGQIPLIALYNIPHRDCGYYAAGGLTPQQYRTWIDTISTTIGKARIGVVLEPDAIHVTDCLSAAQKAQRWSLIRYAAQTLKERNPGAVVYIATVASTWNMDQHVAHLRASGVELTRGIALNVSGFEWTKDCIAIAQAYRHQLGLEIHSLIDTSRNGNGPNTSAKDPEAQWCNPPGRAYGVRSTTDTGHPIVDAYVWIKGTELDGDCWKSQHFEHAYDFILQMAHNTWGSTV